MEVTCGLRHFDSEEEYQEYLKENPDFNIKKGKSENELMDEYLNDFDHQSWVMKRIKEIRNNEIIDSPIEED